MNRPIFLIGYMASGKTTLGRVLARALGRRFIDLDFYIEQRYHLKVPEIFRLRGEEEFRRMESAMLRETGEMEDVVIACGGGTPCAGDNMDWMSARGTTIFLDASVPVIARRVAQAPGKRPLLDGLTASELESRVSTHLASRLPFYTRAAVTLPSDRLESREQIETTLQELLLRLRPEE